MTLWHWAAVNPEKPAIIMGSSGRTVTYGQLEERSRRIDRLLDDLGIGVGGVVAVLMENRREYLELYFGVVRGGRYFVPINRHATAAEAQYLVEDSAAAVVITTGVCPGAAGLPELVPDRHLFSVGTGIPGYRALETALSDVAEQPYRGNVRGLPLYYSSGTTGRPKGIKREIPGTPFEESSGFEEFLTRQYEMTDRTVYLSTGPQYHSAPLTFPATVIDSGGTAVIMERFDPTQALQLIERHQVTTSQWVPTMFKRLLDLPENVRVGPDLSSHRLALLSAAPCPPEIKRAMLQWWGPVIVEYYGASETYGMTVCRAQEWLEHPGSVGRPVLGVPHICDDAGEELPAGVPGTLYFERDSDVFSYHNDPDKTERSRHPSHPFWRKVGDIGYLDAEGYLYLTDREAHMIISGGSNIYPQEIEDALISCPEVIDAAVIGVPDADLGEIVKAVVQLRPGLDSATAISRLTGWLTDRIAKNKLPRAWEFVSELPRLDNGKLYKHKLRGPAAS